MQCGIRAVAFARRGWMAPRCCPNCLHQPMLIRFLRSLWKRLDAWIPLGCWTTVGEDGLPRLAGWHGGWKPGSSKSMDFQSGSRFLDAVTSNSRCPSDWEACKPPCGPVPESAPCSSQTRLGRSRPRRFDSIPPGPPPDCLACSLPDCHLPRNAACTTRRQKFS